MLNILINILVRLNEKNIKALSEKSQRLNYNIYQLYRNNYWWKQKVEYLLDKNFKDLRIDWYDIYEKIYDRKNDNEYNDLSNMLISAAIEGNIELINVLMLSAVDPSEKNNKALEKASEYGHLQIIERLLQDSRVDPNDNNNDAIIKASRGGHLAVVERLLNDSRVNPGDANNAAIILASQNGYLPVVERLLNDTRV